MNNIYFDNVVQIDRLYLEHIFYEFESEPVIFSCVDEDKNIYLCLCCEIRYCQRWLVTKCSIATLKSLIDEEIDIATAFLKYPDIISIEMDIQGNENSSIIKKEEIDSLDLPKEGTYIRCDKEKAKNYIWNKECEALCEKLKLTIDKTPIINEKIESYSSVIYGKLNMQGKQMNIYSNSDAKIFIEHCGKMRDTLEETMAIKQEYSIRTKEKYVEIIDSVDVGDAYDNGYLEAV